MIYGAILAGGTGSRMKSIDIPKQFVEMGESLSFSIPLSTCWQRSGLIIFISPCTLIMRTI